MSSAPRFLSRDTLSCGGKEREGEEEQTYNRATGKVAYSDNNVPML